MGRVAVVTHVVYLVHNFYGVEMLGVDLSGLRT